MNIKKLLEDVRDGKISPEEASVELKKEPFEDLGYAKVDHHRTLRQGVTEVIFGSGKTPEQILGIVNSLKKDDKCILATRVTEESYIFLNKH